MIRHTIHKTPQPYFQLSKPREKLDTVEKTILTALGGLIYENRQYLIVATASKATRMLTEDFQAGQTIQGMLIVNPFK